MKRSNTTAINYFLLFFLFYLPDANTSEGLAISLAKNVSIFSSGNGLLV